MATNRLVSTRQATQVPRQMQSRKILRYIWQGAFSNLRSRTMPYRLQWVQGYLAKKLSEREDMRGQYRKTEVFGLIVQYVVRNAGENIHFARMARTLELDVRIARSYMQALKSLGVVVEIPAWTRRKFTRMAKASKWVVVDWGLVCAFVKAKDARDYLRRIQTSTRPELLWRKVLIPLVATRLQRLMQKRSGWTMYHLCASDRYAVDFLLENPKGEWIAIDVAGTSLCRNLCTKNVQWAQDYFTTHKTHSFVLYLGEQVRRLAKNRYAVPLISLWDPDFFHLG